jgi:hypothetical protein
VVEVVPLYFPPMAYAMGAAAAAKSAMRDKEECFNSIAFFLFVSNVHNLIKEELMKSKSNCIYSSNQKRNCSAQ